MKIGGIITLIIVLFTALGQLFAAESRKEEICFKYSFRKGDSLTYSCQSRDSIYMPYRETILRSRKETIAVVCDSVSPEGLFRIVEVLKSAEITESGKDVGEQTRSETPWLGRKVWFWIDSVGMRHSFGAEDTLQAASSPGGAFQPHLFFMLGGTCHKLRKSWDVDTTVDLPENSIPAPILKYYSLFRNLPYTDTLGQKYRTGQYSLTGQGSTHVFTAQSDTIRMTTVIAQFGKFLWGNMVNAPAHFYATTENKFTVTFGASNPDGKVVGKHYINTYYTLTDVRLADGRTWKINRSVKNKKKKSIFQEN